MASFVTKKNDPFKVMIYFILAVSVETLVTVNNYSIQTYAHTDNYIPPSDETIFIYRNLHSAMVSLAYQDQMGCLEYPGSLDRKDLREGKV